MPINIGEGESMIQKMKTLAVLCFVAIPVLVSSETKKPVDGYGSLKWGSSLPDSRKGIKGKIVFDDEKRIIVTREGEITFRYGFVYKEPAANKEAQPAEAQPQPTAQPAADQSKPAVQPAPAAAKPAPTPASAKSTEGETKLFYVITEFPYIALDDIKKKMIAEYGDPSGDTITKNQGALIWDSGDGVAIVWVDAYEKKSYCRRISYHSKIISKELSTNLYQEFNKREIDVIKKLAP
jgi:hypothetical protein